MKAKILLAAAALVAIGWLAAAPDDYHQVPDAIVFSDGATQQAKAVEHSDEFAKALETLPSAVPGHDDILFLNSGRGWLLSAMDGRIWSYDPRTQKAEVFVDPPLMAAGMHESPTDHDTVYFCASHLWGDQYPEDERVGLYRLRVSTRKIEPVVLDVPDTRIAGAKAWGLSDAHAPRLTKDGSTSSASRPLAFCNDLEVSADGKRVYFTEPFAYKGASMGGGTIPEVLAFQGNGRIWMHELTTGETRLVVEGIHFPDGILVEQLGQEQEDSILTSQTTGFKILRIFVRGPKAGQTEVVQDSLPGMCDGLDRDSQGNIWCAMYAARTGSITWIHAHPWVKHILLRLPLNWIPQPKLTGVMVLSPDGSKILYTAWYQGEKLSHAASALPGPDGYIYMAPFSREHRGIVRLKNPLSTN